LNRPLKVLRGRLSAIREWFAAVTSQSERTIMLAAILLASVVSALTGFFLAQYYSVDVLSSLVVFFPEDCYLDWPTKAGRHCFSDYSITVTVGMASNPWAPFPLYLPPDFEPAHFNYPAAGMVPHLVFGTIGKWLGAPRLGLLGYLVVLTIAVLTPAVWAARGAQGLEKVVVFVACGAAALPAWVAIDRGNSVGFVVPVALAFLVALCRRRWGLVAITVVLAALVKPQFAVLAIALFAARQWRWGGFAVVGALITNLAAYLLWPRDFPQTIVQSIHNTIGYDNGGVSRAALVANSNVSFGKGLLAVPDAVKAYQTGGTIPVDYLAGPRSLLGYAVLVLVVVSVLALGRRMAPVMVGVVLLATASLFPALSNPYYLVFVLPVAALVARDPDGPPGTGIFDRPATVGGRRRAIGICVSLAVVLCISQIAVPTPPLQIAQSGAGSRAVVITTVFLAPLLWLVTCAVIIVAYARQPASSTRSDQWTTPKCPPDNTGGTSSHPNSSRNPHPERHRVLG